MHELFILILGLNAEIQFSIIGGNVNNMFRITTEGEIKTRGNPDREQRDQYSLQISAKDLGVPSRSLENSCRISISDMNDNSPVFEKSVYHARLRENIAVGTDIQVQVYSWNLKNYTPRASKGALRNLSNIWNEAFSRK